MGSCSSPYCSAGHERPRISCMVGQRARQEQRSQAGLQVGPLGCSISGRSQLKIVNFMLQFYLILALLTPLQHESLLHATGSDDETNQTNANELDEAPPEQRRAEEKAKTRKLARCSVALQHAKSHRIVWGAHRLEMYAIRRSGRFWAPIA